MPYDRYTEITFDYGCVIDKNLWEQVQEKVKKMYEFKAKGVKRCYPLSGLLMLQDGSHFVGNGAWGKTCQSTYYYNQANKVRVRTEVFERKTEKMLNHFIECSKEFQSSMSNYMSQKDDAINILTEKIDEIDTQLKEIDLERERLDKRLDFLLNDDPIEVDESLRNECRKQYLSKKSKSKS